MKDADYRWINRGGVDLLGANPDAPTSRFGLPRARALYGPLPEQLRDPASFAARLKQILAARKKHRIHEGELLAVPEVNHSAAHLLVMRTPGKPALVITAVNFSHQPIEERIELHDVGELEVSAFVGQVARDCISTDAEGEVTPDGALNISLEEWSGKTLILEP